MCQNRSAEYSSGGSKGRSTNLVADIYDDDDDTNDMEEEEEERQKKMSRVPHVMPKNTRKKDQFFFLHSLHMKPSTSF